ncbi:hypothetical protein ACIQLK_05725 [Microbacterium sp. NPDC091382]|uniref:hypothetical protein n=1 Tax=Microbacterium sp. NPDC091382 TaxID=3364210 RepID=UPI0037F318D4
MLRELGYASSDSGRFDWKTREAFAKMLADRGLKDSTDRSYGSVRLRDIVWLPSSPSTVTACGATLGAQVTDGATILSIGGGVTAVTYPQPNDLQKGARQLSVGGIVIAADESGRITDPEAIRTLIAEPTVASFLERDEASAESSDVVARLELVDPETVYGVPPSALIGVRASSACVVTDGRAIPVTVVASSLGVTYVSFEAGASVDQVESRPESSLPCS